MSIYTTKENHRELAERILACVGEETFPREVVIEIIIKLIKHAETEVKEVEDHHEIMKEKWGEQFKIMQETINMQQQQILNHAINAYSIRGNA